ncbi:MAG: hypothetical protein HGA85_04200 [Nanoarchaeota archaeon]|nr:hypothetical protein [Nanoarchaeota archaeon]
MDKINVGIDGLSATSKDTVTKLLFYVLNHLPAENPPAWSVIDSSSMYRAASLFLERNGKDLGIRPMSLLNRADPMVNLEKEDLGKIITCVENLELGLDFLVGVRCTYGKEQGKIEQYYTHNELQGVDVGTYAGMLGRIDPVRPCIVAKEREQAKAGYCLVPGRDSFTVVLKDIPGTQPVGIYTYTDFGARVKRRLDDALSRGKNTTELDIIEALKQRDILDLGRAEAPLPPNPVYARAAGYSVVDTTALSFDDMGIASVNIVLDAMKLHIPQRSVRSLVHEANAAYGHVGK